jgi:uncharacterized protein with HEPN domain
MRNYKIYVKDILNSINKIEKYCKKIKSEKEFIKNELVLDASIRNLQIIGEAVKNIPAETKNKFKEIEWKKISGLRDILVHAYFGVSPELVYDIIKNNLPELKQKIKKIK